MTTSWKLQLRRIVTSVMNIFNKSGVTFNQSGTLFGGVNPQTPWTFTNKST